VRRAIEVARRCLCLELLAQRLALETDDAEPAAARDGIRASWLARLGDLDVAEVLLAEERALLERPVGDLSEADVDDIDGRASGALVLLWALGRLDSRPSIATVDAIAETLEERGLLGDGSIRGARAAAAGAALRPPEVLDEALGAYLRRRGKAREVSDPERVFAEVAAHHLTWILDPAMAFDDDIAIS
jgi:hypothetical protein